jgi:type II secretory pathway pseudopilin PulG
MSPIPPVIWKVIGAAAILAAAYGAGWFQANGANRKEYEAQLSRQIAKAAQSQFDLETIRAQYDALKLTKETEQQTRIEFRDREVIRYVKSPAKKCVVSDELERAHDALTILHDIVSSPDRVPSSSETAGGADEPPAAGLPHAGRDPGPPLDDSVMLEAYGMCLEAYSSLWDTYSLLRDWNRVTYVRQREALGYKEEGM